jgi:hypothetical protein
VLPVQDRLTKSPNVHFQEPTQAPDRILGIIPHGSRKDAAFTPAGFGSPALKLKVVSAGYPTSAKIAWLSWIPYIGFCSVQEAT